MFAGEGGGGERACTVGVGSGVDWGFFLAETGELPSGSVMEQRKRGGGCAHVRASVNWPLSVCRRASILSGSLELPGSFSIIMAAGHWRLL